MLVEVTCPVCRNLNKAKCQEIPTAIDGRESDCERCGKYKISGTVLQDNEDLEGYSLTNIERVCLSQRLRIGQIQSDIPFIMSDWLKEFRKTAKLSLPPVQARKIIECIGDYFSTNGEPMLHFPQSKYGKIGFYDRGVLNSLVRDLKKRGLITCVLTPDSSSGFGHPRNLNLTLSGWNEYESLKSGLRAEKTGFLAMKFGDEI